MDRLLEQSNAGEHGNACADDVFIVHWTHVPKAGALRLPAWPKNKCARNPRTLPQYTTCPSSRRVASTLDLPLVQGIGKHTEHALCVGAVRGREWYLQR